MRAIVVISDFAFQIRDLKEDVQKQEDETAESRLEAMIKELEEIWGKYWMCINNDQRKDPI